MLHILIGSINKMTKAMDILNRMYSSVPLIFGHSGAQAYAPSNTLPAFELALQQGAHGIELDVHRSKDGHPVIVHDFTVDATSNARGRVADLTLKELKSLDVGSWFSSEFAGVKIPTLDEVFETVGHKLYVNVEIKSDMQESDGIEQCVADCILRHHMQERVFVSCFNLLTLRRFRAIMPDVPLGFLYGKNSPEIAHELIKGFEVEALHPEALLVDQALVDRAHSAGQRVNVWTVNDVKEAQQLAKQGVDCIMTDVPDKVLEAIQ